MPTGLYHCLKEVTTLHFSYRAYSRTRERDQLEGIRWEVVENFSEADYRERILVSESDPTYWPIDPQQVNEFRERGILLTEKGDALCAVVQELKCQIKCDSFQEAEQLSCAVWLTNSATYSPSTIKIVTEWITEINPI